MGGSHGECCLEEDRATFRPSGRGGPSGRTIAFVTCFSLALAELIVMGVCYAHERITLLVHAHDIIPQRDLTNGRFAFYAPGIERPAAHAAQDARLADEEAVLGVDVGGRFRAYRLEALRDRYNHIVNDVIDGRPISVTYCDINDFAAGFTGDRPGIPLSISQGGVFSGGMVICIGEAEYAQQTLEPVQQGKSVPGFPYRSIPLVRTTWKLWRGQHPESDVYEGAIEASEGPVAVQNVGIK